MIHKLFNTKFKKNIIGTLSRQGIVTVLQFFTVVLIARSLGPEGTGLYSMAVLLPTMLVNMFNLGIAPATIYFISRKEISALDSFTLNLKCALQLSFLGVLVAVPILSVGADYLLPNVPNTLIVLGLISFPIILINSYLQAIILGLEDYKKYNILPIISSAVIIIGVSISLYYFELGITYAVFSYIAGNLISLIVCVWCVLRKIKDTNNTSVKSIKGNRAKILNYGWKSYLSNLLAFLNYRLDFFLVNFFLGPIAMGLYVVAVQLSEALWVLSRGICTVLFPRMSALYDDLNERWALMQKSYRLVMLFTSLLGIFLILFLYYFLTPIFGEKYINSLPIFIYLLPGVIFGAGSRVQANFIAASGKPEWNMYVGLAVLVINVLGNLLLIPIWGLKGAAIATSIGYSLNSLAKFILVKKLFVNSIKGNLKCTS